MASNEIHRLVFQAHNEIELFVKSFVRKYRPLFRNRTYGCDIHASEIPEIDFACMHTKFILR